MTLLAGQKLHASDVSIPAYESFQTDSGTVAGATYTGTRTGSSNVAGYVFTAPNSGSIMVLWGAGISVTGAFALMAFEIRTGGTLGSGTVIAAASDNVQCQGTATTETTSSNSKLITGLSAGSTYNIRAMYRTQSVSVTGTYNRPHIAHIPFLA